MKHVLTEPLRFDPFHPLHRSSTSLHQAFPSITFTSTIQNTCRFRRLSLKDGIFHAVENGEKFKTRDFDDTYLAIGCSNRRSPGADCNRKGRTYWDDKWKTGMVSIRPKKRSATRGLPRRSHILVLFSPKHASLHISDGIRCISAGMIAIVMFLCRSFLKSIVSER